MTLVFLVEEKSMKCFLDGILPRILPEGVLYITIAHEGKSDLQKSIPHKLRGWTTPDVKFVIVQDQDSNDCRKLKQRLVELCENSGKEVLVRIACHELEAWYFGDMNAVSQAYHKDLESIKRKKLYRVPDNIINPKKELQKILPEHQQILGAKKIAAYIDVGNNSSTSFNVFVEGVQRLCGGLETGEIMP